MQKNRVYLHFCRREKEKIQAFTVHHTGSTKNIQDLRNFAHFAQKVSTRKYKKKPALDGERVYFKTCAQQASNSRRRGVQNTVHYSYTKSTENLSIFYMVWTGLDGGSMRNLGIVGRKLVSKRGHFPS